MFDWKAHRDDKAAHRNHQSGNHQHWLTNFGALIFASYKQERQRSIEPQREPRLQHANQGNEPIQTRAIPSNPKGIACHAARAPSENITNEANETTKGLTEKNTAVVAEETHPTAHTKRRSSNASRVKDNRRATRKLCMRSQRLRTGDCQVSKSRPGHPRRHCSRQRESNRNAKHSVPQSMLSKPSAPACLPVTL
jgi:hypothetical protein